MKTKRSDELAENLLDKRDIWEMFKSLGANSEDDFLKKVSEEDITLIACVYCNNCFPVENLKFVNGDPYCKECKKEVFG